MIINEIVQPGNYTNLEREKYLKNPNAQDPKALVDALTNLIDNPKMNDAAFREYVRKVLPDFQEEHKPEEIDIPDVAPRANY